MAKLVLGFPTSFYTNWAVQSWKKSKRLEIFDLGRREAVQTGSENKCTYQQLCYCTSGWHLCFCIRKVCAHEVAQCKKLDIEFQLYLKYYILQENFKTYYHGKTVIMTCMHI